jgi:hypothetical protein
MFGHSNDDGNQGTFRPLETTHSCLPVSAPRHPPFHSQKSLCACMLQQLSSQHGSQHAPPSWFSFFFRSEIKRNMFGTSSVRGIKFIHCFPVSCRFSDLLILCEPLPKLFFAARGVRERRRHSIGTKPEERINCTSLFHVWCFLCKAGSNVMD